MRKPRSTISRVARTALAAATTSATLMCSPPARADDASDYAASFGGLVCKQLDATPTLPGVTRVGVLVAGEGFSSYGVTIGHLIGVAFDVSETTGIPLPKYNDDPNWFGGCYREIADKLGYRPTLAGDWWIDAPRWAA